MAQKFIGVTLPIRMGQTGMFEQSTSLLVQVRSNFKNLILTKKGERLGQPDLGCDLRTILFDPTTDDILDRCRAAVADAVDRWLPYLELTDFNITKSDDENKIMIQCSYRFRNNPNVTDSVNILTTALGAPAVAFPTEPPENTTMKNPGRPSRVRRGL